MKTTRMKHKTVSATLLLLGAMLVGTYQVVDAKRDPPTKHKGVSVVNLGKLTEATLASQIGLSGHVMRLREITLEPGGQIAKHDHFTRPGLVWTLAGSWTEGRPGGEKEYPASLKEALLEDATTEHWFWNDGSEPVKVVVCDVVPAK